MQYLSLNVKVMRGREAGKIAELAKNGWELVSQRQGPLRSELAFRKAKPETAFSKLTAAFLALAPETRRKVTIAAGALAASLVLVVGITAAVSGDDDKSDPEVKSAKRSNGEPKPSPRADPTKSQEPASESSAPAAPAKPAVITAENTPTFGAMLQREDECHDDYANFAKKHEGDKIAFDGSVAAISPHDNYKTRFDYLISPGDDGPNTVFGPRFRYEDVNYSNFGLTGDNQPESLEVGALLRFTAEVGKYDPDTCLFGLKPVETEAR